MPAGATDRTMFEGVKTTVRTVRMVKEARLLFQLRGGGISPGISQGGYSTAVSASSGTHNRDAMDDKTRLMSSSRRNLWEWCNWEVGFAGWQRVYIAGLWPVHFHKLPKDGDLSEAAERQIVQWHQGDDALKSDRDYPRILSSGFRSRTWESYLSGRPTGNVNRLELAVAFRAGTSTGTNDVHQVQKALNHFLDSKLLVDGIPGPATRGVYQTYQSRLYRVPKTDPAADGIPGQDSLEKLGLTVV